MVNHIKNLIRIKKFKPYYELYDVENNNVSSFISSCNDASLLPNDLKQIRVILSSILSVEGSRPMNLTKLSQTQKSQFFFSHSIISDESDLIFSEPIVSNNQLKQLWLGKKDYQEKIFPLIERYKNKIESVMSEKSSFEINKNIQFQDIESPSKIIKSDQLVDFPITYYSMKDIPSLIKILQEVTFFPFNKTTHSWHDPIMQNIPLSSFSFGEVLKFFLLDIKSTTERHSPSYASIVSLLTITSLVVFPTVL